MDEIWLVRNGHRHIGVFTTKELADQGILDYHTKKYKAEFSNIHFDGLVDKSDRDMPDYYSGYIYYINNDGDKEALDRVSAEVVPVNIPFNCIEW